MISSKAVGQTLKKLTRFLTTLESRFFRPVGTVDMRFYQTFDVRHTIPDDECFGPLPESGKWGEEWAYGWFKGSYTVPAVNVPMAGLYAADTASPRLPYPVAFWESPVEVVTMRPALLPCINITVEGNTSTETGAYGFLSVYPAEVEQQVTMDYFVTGYWKIPEEEIQ